ncbi:MAG: hypothetical protein DHS80DRAFT_30484 [Piptocephalis tieghemiana]|nr:MAG: hypothetical protein DHS80DRAFT_30484 [Piptocephalis tieghemiana]
MSDPPVRSGSLPDTLRIAIAMALVVLKRGAQDSPSPHELDRCKQVEHPVPMGIEGRKDNKPSPKPDGKTRGDLDRVDHQETPGHETSERHTLLSPFIKLCLSMKDSLDPTITFPPALTFLCEELSRIILTIAQTPMLDGEALDLRDSLYSLQESLDDTLNGCFGFVLLHHLLESLHPNYPKGNGHIQWILAQSLLPLSASHFPLWIQVEWRRLLWQILRMLDSPVPSIQAGHPFPWGLRVDVWTLSSMIWETPSSGTTVAEAYLISLLSLPHEEEGA